MKGSDTLDEIINIIKETDNVQKVIQTSIVKESTYSKHQEEAPYELGIYSDERDISYMRIGDLLFLNSKIKAQMESLPGLIYLWQFKTSMINHTFHFYSVVTAHAIANIDLKDKVVLDLGAADGLQSLVAYQRGAQHIIAIDRDNINEVLFWLHIKVNKMNKRSFSYLIHDINFETWIYQKPKLAKKLTIDDIDLVVANIGPYYGSTHLSAIDLIPSLPKVKYYVLGGYIYPQALTAEEKKKCSSWFPNEAISRLEYHGFKVTSLFWDKKRKAMSLVAERSE